MSKRKNKKQKARRKKQPQTARPFLSGHKKLDEILAKALQYHQDGDLDQAESLYRSIVRMAPEYPDALHLLGVICSMTGRLEEAVRLIKKSIKVAPMVDHYHFNLGSAYTALGNLEAATRCYKEAARLNPDDIKPRLKLGNLYHLQRMLPEAVDCYKQVLERDNENLDAQNNLGVAYQGLGDLNAAAECFTKSFRINPDFAEAHNNLGGVLQIRGDAQGALDHFTKALQLKPDYPELHNNLGNYYRDQEQYDLAGNHYATALKQDPNYIAAYNNLGISLRAQGRLQEAVEQYEQALKLAPNYAEAHNNLGNVFKDIGLEDKAEAEFNEALLSKSDDPETHNNLANVLYRQGRYGEALERQDKVLSINPDCSDARHGRSISLLALGRLSEGWKDNEWRFKKKKDPIRKPIFTQPAWNGEPLTDRSILIYAEQGVGDEILYSSCYQDVVDRAGDCIVQCDLRLKDLLKRSFPEAKVVGAARDDTQWPSRVPAFDVHIAAGSLPGYFRQELTDFPEHNGYLKTDQDLESAWRDRLAEVGGGLKIGVSWRSVIKSENREKYFTGIRQWKPVFQVPGITFVNLQFDECNLELEEVQREFGIKLHSWNDMDLFNNFEEAAALISNLDLVITGPASTADLAGALGRPVWMLAFYPIWKMLGTGGMPWYPNTRVFFREHNEKREDTIRTLTAELERLITE